ncbi:MAG: hypothetical protein JO001_22950 [Alphaproteobacteria bacterium]|nr:hypothetical protein [Alphaproteobacteria bacterium]
MADPRTRAVDLPGFDGPSISTVTPTPIQAPTVAPATQGLEGLSSALNNFFGKTEEGLGAVAQAAEYEQKQDVRANFFTQRAAVEQQNATKTQQATADALAGTPETQAQTADNVYHEAYSKAAGVQHGIDLESQWFNDVYSNAKPGDNLMGLTDQWLKQNWGQGTGNPAYDSAALSRFKSGIDRNVLQFQENSVKSVIAQGLQQQTSVVADAVRNNRFNAPFIQQSIASLQALDPAHPEDAAARLGQMARSAIVDGNPATAQSLLAALEAPGSAANGKSYAQMYPEAYKETQQTLIAAYLRGGSLQGASAWSDLQNQALAARGDPGKLGVIASQLMPTLSRFGGVDHYTHLNATISGLIADAASSTIGANQVEQMANGAMPVVGKTVDKFLPSLLQAKGIDPCRTLRPLRTTSLALTPSPVT